MDRLKFVEELELGEVPIGMEEFTSRTLTDNPKGTASVDAGSLIAFLPGVSDIHQRDVKNSLLLAQLAANVAADRENDVEKWYRKYREVLENIGWVLSGFAFEKIHTFGSQFQVSEEILKVLGAIATQNELLIAKAMLEAMKALSSGDKRLTLWNAQTHSQSAGNFQITTCLEKGRNVGMSLGAFFFAASTIDVRWLWYKYNQENMQIYKSTQDVVLNEDVYSQIREAVVKKLGDRAAKYLADLDIGDF